MRGRDLRTTWGRKCNRRPAGRFANSPYAERHHTGRNWLFLTGRPDALELLRVKLGYADSNPVKDRKDKSLHSGMVRYGNEPLSQWSSVQGSADPEWIAEEIMYVVPGDEKRRS